MEHVPHSGSMIDGAMWTRGMGRHGQLDLGDSNDWLVPRWVGAEEAFRGSPVLMAACGNWNTLAVTKASTLWSWSLGRDGKLSHNDANNRLVPTQVEAQRFGDAKIVSATARETYPAAITKYGTLYTWGKGTCEMWDTEGVVAEVLWGLGHGDNVGVPVDPTRPSAAVTLQTQWLQQSATMRWPSMSSAILRGRTTTCTLHRPTQSIFAFFAHQ